MEEGGRKESRRGSAGIAYEADRSLLVVAAPPAAERVRRMADAAGLRLAGIVTVSEGPERIGRQAAFDILHVELDGEEGDAADALLDQVEPAAAAGRCAVVLVFPFALVDRIAARGFGPAIRYLCDPDDAERATALALAAAPGRPMLNDVTKGQATARLQQLSEEVGRIASMLASLSEDEAVVAATAAASSQVPHEAEEEQPALDPGQIRALIRVRRLRDHFFNKELFADPAWDMLLDLMAARLERQRVAVSSLCIAAAVPPTTALRWIKALCDQGLFVRVADPEDGRRVFIELSDDAAQRLEAYLKEALRVSPGPI